VADLAGFCRELEAFTGFGTSTQIRQLGTGAAAIPVYVNEFWTARQRAAHSLHEVSYRACFKPQLPRFFIERLTAPGAVVYDPFMGRGTTLLEAALHGRRPAGCDINPLSQMLVRPRLEPPDLDAVVARLASLSLDSEAGYRDDLLAFYHPQTLRQLCGLRAYLAARQQQGALDAVDGWIRMVATNRLTGHSAGFLSVYTLPPNQAVSVASQQKINARRLQTPPRRDLRQVVSRKSRSLLADLNPAQALQLEQAGRHAVLLTGSSDATPDLPAASVHLVVTSPPFLDVVDYQTDNWLRCWFNGIDPDQVSWWHWRRLADWQAAMTRTFSELRRVLVPGGWVAFEVGEVRSGKVQLETVVVPAGRAAGLEPLLVVVNDQAFTKTANCWGVDNRTKGTNTNRIVLLRRPA
jgi:hypothetical protein